VHPSCMQLLTCSQSGCEECSPRSGVQPQQGGPVWLTGQWSIGYILVLVPVPVPCFLLSPVFSFSPCPRVRYVARRRLRVIVLHAAWTKVARQKQYKSCKY